MNDFSFYEQMTYEELVEDPEFKAWVFTSEKNLDNFWKEFLVKYPHRSQDVENARNLLLATRLYFEKNDLSKPKIEANLSKLLVQVPKKRVRTQKKLKPWHKWVSIAASLLILLGFSIWYITPKNHEILTYETTYGDWKQVTLPDGSKVHLNANSKLTLASDWSFGEIRQVWLTGEAFFEVEKKNDGRTKFQVITNDLVVEVLGTQFNVHHRGEHTEVFLKEGKIKLDLEGTAEYMNPGEFVSYSANSKSILSRTAIPQENYTSWKEGSLQMNATIGEILTEIEVIYGVTVEVRDSSLLEETRNIGVPMKELATVIPILEISLDREIIKDGNKLIIRE